MKQEIIDKYVSSLNETNEKIQKQTSPVVQAMMWFESVPVLLKPVWQDGYDEGHKAGLVKGKEQMRITKSN